MRYHHRMDAKLQDRTKATAAEKQEERHRARARAGRAILTIEVDLAEVGDLLRDAGVISPTAEDDRVTLARGLERLLQRLKRYG